MSKHESFPVSFDLLSCNTLSAPILAALFALPSVARGAEGAKPDIQIPCTKVASVATLHAFDGSDGFDPYSSVIQASNGNYYGATAGGGAWGIGGNGGVVYQVTSYGAFETLYSFNPQSGPDANVFQGSPRTNLLQGSDGNLYGGTWTGNAYANGIVYRVSPTGSFATVHAFASDGSEGAGPGALVEGTDGNYYGTTEQPFVLTNEITGATANSSGTVFRLTPAGVLTTLHRFSGPDGAIPNDLTVAGGVFYGTTQQGGASGDGAVFTVTSTGALSTVYSFSGPDGRMPVTPLVPGPNGSFYGTTLWGGSSDNGTIFQITPNACFRGAAAGRPNFLPLPECWTLTTLHSFTGASDGALPNSLALGNDGNLYGTTSGGNGTIFRISPGNGAFSTLYTFMGAADGENPQGIIQGSDGNFYGVTGSFLESNGNVTNGTVFVMQMVCQQYIGPLPPNPEVVR